jgi:hypothetical protein
MEGHLEALLEMDFCTKPPNFGVEAHMEAPAGDALRHIPEHFELGPTRPAGSARARPEPGPPTNLTGWAWVEILKPAKNFWPEPDQKCHF